MAKKVNAKNEKFTCDLCNKSYKTERGLVNHSCRSKLRLQEYKTTYGRIAFVCYNLFYKKIKLQSFTKNDRSITEFINSGYYNGFIKVGKYIVDNKIPNYQNYIDFLISHNVKLEKWSNDEIYKMYTKTTMRKENTETALEKSLKTMSRWSDSTRKPWQAYFNEEDKARILHSIRTGRISPWVIYNCDTGKLFLSTLDNYDLDAVFEFIDPSYWKTKFLRQEDCTKVVNDVLREAGL